MDAHDIRRYIRSYDGDLDGELCERMIASFESPGAQQQPNGRGYRAGLEHSAWTELNLTRTGSDSLLRIFRRKLDLALRRYNDELAQTMAIPNSPKTADLILKRYRAGSDERFQLHFDSINEVANRYLVFLWYLNDVADGGETEFPDLGVRIAARRGRLLMFPPYWNFQHAGRPPRSNDKYILSTYLLF